MHIGIAEGNTRKDMPAQVVVYTSNDCYWCGKAKEYLTRKGVPYIEKNVEEDETYGMEAMSLSGQHKVPVIAVGSRAIVGFQRRELDAELDAFLGLGTPNIEATDPRT